MSKKLLIITLAIFITVTSLALASNIIRWDETPLEQSIFALPLAVGMILEMPFLIIASPLAQDDSTYVYFEQIKIFIPFVAGVFYSGLFYFIVFIVKKILKRLSLKKTVVNLHIMKKWLIYSVGFFVGLIVVLFLMYFNTKTTKVLVVSADCGDISEIGSPKELFEPATVRLKNVVNDQLFTLRFPAVFLGADMPVFNSFGQKIEVWQSSQFCGDRGLFGYTDFVEISDSLFVTYNHFGKIVSWQLAD